MSDNAVRRTLPPSPKRRTFRPVVTPDGQLQAGGCTLATVENAPEGGGPVLVFRDRYKRRCKARGTDDVRVWLREIVEAVECQERVEPERPLGDCDCDSG